MLPIHSVYGVPLHLERIAQQKLKEIVQHFFIINSEIYPENDFSYIFPEYLYSTQKNIYDLAVRDIRLWSQDPFERELKPIHEYILYYILNWASDVEKDFKSETNESLFFTDIPPDPHLCEDNNEWSLNDLSTLDFYLNVCFLDYDFSSVSDFVNLIPYYSYNEVESMFNIDLASFGELIPLDIRKKIFDEKIENNNSVTISNVKDSVIILGNSEHLNYTGKLQINSAFEDLESYIINLDALTTNEKTKLLLDSNELKQALSEKDMVKVNTLYNRLTTTLGNISSLTTIGQFFSGIFL